MDQTGVRNQLLIKVFLLTAVTAIKEIWDNKCLWQHPFRNVLNFLQERCCTLTGKPVFSSHSKNENIYLNYLEYTNSSFWEEKKKTCILMDQTGVRNELLIKVFLLTAVTAIKEI